jgi:hypothetical protein
MSGVDRQLSGVLVCLILGVVVGGAFADEPDWTALPYTSHSAYQAVDGNGFATFPTDSPIKMQGVLLNRGADILNGDPNVVAFLGAQWQVYVQATEPGDFGGTAVFMAEKYGNLPFVDPSQSYTPAEFLLEIDRLEHDPNTGAAFEPGDLVEIRARAPGLPFAGKTNINEQHSKALSQDFDVILLEKGYGVPMPVTLALDALKDASDAFAFDATRQTGCERYQGMLVRFEDITLVDAAGWGPNADLLVTDGTYTFPIKLGLGTGYEDYPAPSEPFDVIGILDQEDGTDADGYRGGYRLWVAGNYEGNACFVPAPPTLLGDMDCDGDVDFDDINPFVTAIGNQGAYLIIYPCCDWLHGDFDGDFDVDFDDITPFVNAIGTR